MTGLLDLVLIVLMIRWSPCSAFNLGRNFACKSPLEGQPTTGRNMFGLQSLQGMTIARRCSMGPSDVKKVQDIIDKYDMFLLDQFGVLHNGAIPMAGAIDCFEMLAKAGKKIVILSNTSRRATAAIKSLTKLGFDVDRLSGFVCSGEEARRRMHIEKRSSKATIFTLFLFVSV